MQRHRRCTQRLCRCSASARRLSAAECVQRDVRRVWNKVKDGLVLPLLRDGAALGLCEAPPGLLALPTELLDQLLGCLQVPSHTPLPPSRA